ncbi:MAG TPA: PadR family transcriptional regulator [Streptosporangiaceae bacterium]
MNERDTRSEEFGGHRGPHPHRHHGGRRFRARLGPPDFGQGAGEPGGPGGPRTRARASFGPGFGPGSAADGPGFYGPFHGGPGGFGPRGRYGRRGGRAKRGDVRAAALALLAEEPMNGYQIIQQISERSGGLWRPSPGSVYPALAQLEDENLVVLQATAGERRSYALTDAGREYVTEHADEMKAPWSAVSGDAASAAADLHALVRQVHVAAFGVLNAGTAAQMAQARKILAQTRRSLYRILAEDDEADDAQAEQAQDRD